MATGAALLYFIVWSVVDQHGVAVGSDISVIDSSYWIGVGIAFWVWSDIVNIGLTRRWSRWPQVAVVGVAGILAVAGLVAYQAAWAAPLGWGVFVFTEFALTVLAISLILAAILSIPG